MRILVTGITGFVGRFLTNELSRGGHEVVGIDLTLDGAPSASAETRCVDLTSAEAVIKAVDELAPDACIHLGGIASPPVGRLQPELMLNTNILGTAHILEALHQKAPQARVLLASTAYVYGTSETSAPIDEDAPLSPIGVYAVSKAAADMMVLAYARDYGLDTMVARAANHTGPGQSPDYVVPAFAQQIKSMQATGTHVIRVGNLDSERSFMDVRDVVRAYRLLIEKGRRGRAYNVATSKRVPIRQILETLCSAAGVTPTIEADPTRYRPTDKSPLLSTQRIEADTGWQPQIDLDTTLTDVLENV